MKGKTILIFLALILLIGIIYYYAEFKPQVFFFSSLPSASVIPNEINQGDTAKVKFSALLQEVGATSGAYFHSVFINTKNLCFNIAGTSNEDIYKSECPISNKAYNVGDNKIEVFQGYKAVSGGAVVPSGCFKTYEGALAYNNYKNKFDNNKLLRQCIYGTENGETYSSSDQRWYQYPLNTEFERICNYRPGDSGGGDGDGSRARGCFNYLDYLSNYEKKDLILKVIDIPSIPNPEPQPKPKPEPEPIPLPKPKSIFSDLTSDQIFYIALGILGIIFLFIIGVFKFIWRMIFKK